MTEDRFLRVKQLFLEVADLDEAQRETRLDQSCANDPDLRDEVMSLLESDREATTFIEHAAIGSLKLTDAFASEQPADPLEGRRVGAYVLRNRIGAGGMGAVYLAERADGAFDQTVAVKVVKRGMDTDEILRRFRTERQTLANFNHPNIARLLDGGALDDGRPYLVMEHIDGAPINEFCESRKLDIPARVNLFLKVCDAVQHAHQSLIVHRDLKPGNILIDHDGVPKLLDFGIAKLLRSEGVSDDVDDLTQEKSRRLTPAYASPEQRDGGPVTTASDVYSLGVILYRLLARRAPHERSTIERQSDTSRTSDVPRPSAVALPAVGVATARDSQHWRKQLRGDLDNIVLKAMHIDPARRYRSAAQLADDLERWKSGRPVLAQRDTFSYRAHKFMRRNRAGVFTAALIAISLIGGIVATSWQARAANRERDRTALEARRAQTINEFLTSTLSSADPVNDGRDVRVADVLDRASATIDTNFADHPVVLAVLHNTLGRTYWSLGLFEAAADHHRAAVELKTEHLGPDDPSTLRAINDYATAQQDLGRHEEAEALFRRNLETRRRVLGPGHQETLTSLNNLAELLRVRRQFAEATELFKQALDGRRALLGDEHRETLITLNNLANVLFLSGQIDEAEPHARRAYETQRRVLGPRHIDTLVSMNDLALIEKTSGDLESAEALYREACEGFTSVLGAGHLDTLIAHYNLAGVLHGRQQCDDAAAMLGAIAEQAQVSLPPQPPYHVVFQVGQAQCWIDLGKMEQAERVLIECRDKLEAAVGADHMWTHFARRNLERIADARRVASGG